MTGYEGIASLLSPRHWLLTEAKPMSSQGRGDNKLAIPEYTVCKYFIIPREIVQFKQHTFSRAFMVRIFCVLTYMHLHARGIRLFVYQMNGSYMRMNQISYRGFPRKMPKKKLAHFKFHYTDAVISLINCTFGDYIDDWTWDKDTTDINLYVWAALHSLTYT